MRWQYQACILNKVMGMVYRLSVYRVDMYVLVFLILKGGLGAVWVILGLLSFNQSQNKAKQKQHLANDYFTGRSGTSAESEVRYFC